jgi:hypothetical protein
VAFNEELKEALIEARDAILIGIELFNKAEASVEGECHCNIVDPIIVASLKLHRFKKK